jgi:enterochelin esterase-like enzyme
MGGYVSLAFAEKYPEYLKSLTLFFSTYFPDDAEKKNSASKVTASSKMLSRITQEREFRICSIPMKKIFWKEK